jgi:hypothetical protein
MTLNPQVVWTNGTLASLAVGAFVRLMAPWSDVVRDFDWLELDGNEQTVSQSRQPLYGVQGPCPNFPETEVGEHVFKLD